MTTGETQERIAAPAAAFVDVHKSWPGRTILTGTSFAFERGLTYVVSGRSGSGKSTLLNLVAGYTAPDAGTVTAPERVGYLFQDDILFSGITARQNVLVRAALRTRGPELDAIAETCLEAVGMADRADALTALLSGGERQRVQLATVLAGDPQLVILDEPTASLDPDTRRQVAALVSRVFASATVLIVSHDEFLADEVGADVRLVLEGGSLHHA